MDYFRFLLIVLVIGVIGCKSTPSKQTGAFSLANPSSILVVPPENLSIEVNAPYTFLSTISKPLAEKGYYVFPVAVVDRLFKENGVYTTEEMNRIPLDKIREHTGADAVMYVTINDWGQKFQVISSTSVVNAHLRIVDARDGVMLWESSIYKSYGKEPSSSLLDSFLGAVVDQISGTLTDYTPALAREANVSAINSSSKGLPDGPYLIERKHANQ